MDPNPIPEGVLFEILTFLPVKSLCRFRCVSKSWFSIISDPKFVAAHFASSNSRPKLLITTRMGKDYELFDEMKLFSIEYPQEHHGSHSILYATSHGSINTLFTQITSASNNGIICCSCHQGITIGNPITGDFDLIPYSSQYTKKYVYVGSYLGFDPVDNKQLILKLDDYRLASSSVFSVLESQWHNNLLPKISLGPNKSAISMNGVIYFIARTYPVDWKNSITPYGECLCAFDVRLEHFKIIQQPPGSKCTVEHVIEYKDRVALVGYEYISRKEMRLRILEDPEKHSWSIKSFVVPLGTGSPYVRLFGATPRGELMLATELSTQGFFDLFLYKIDTNTLRRFQVLVPTSSMYGEIRVGFLIESLHSPKRTNSPSLVR